MIIYSLLLFLFITCCVILISVILMQSGKGQGLAGVFGGGNVQSMLGPRASDVLEKITWGIVVAFFVLTVLLSLLTGRQQKKSIIDDLPSAQQVQQQAPVTQKPQDMTVPAGEDISVPAVESEQPAIEVDIPSEGTTLPVESNPVEDTKGSDAEN